MGFDLTSVAALGVGTLTTIASGGTVDPATMIGGTASAVFTAALGGWVKSQCELASRVLTEEVARGSDKLIAASEQDGAAMAMWYLRKAAEGTAEHNLRFMARLLAGEAPERPYTRMSSSDMLGVWQTSHAKRSYSLPTFIKGGKRQPANHSTLTS